MKFIQKNVPVVEAIQVPKPENHYEWMHFFDWSEEWGFDFEGTGTGIRFRIKQTMAAEAWATAEPGDWIIHGAFDSYVMDDKSFQSYYKRLDLQ